MTEQTPAVGRIVHFRCVEGDVAPAIITAVHSDRLVNLTVFPDLALPYPFSKADREREPGQ
ncbi:MAG: hypothetical protein MJA83_19195, partial [Gammaproteobacteria bacterium]|nr:hypothetical protein [Gammaproteobacteria bacterium]